ncbi:MAG: hypothetical protein GX436_03145 [Synergistaceae bacterium]|nr:hypothetical protein [Synergistaceae bacterium]
MMENKNVRLHTQTGITRSIDAEALLDEQTGLALAYQEARAATGFMSDWERSHPAKGR